MVAMVIALVGTIIMFQVFEVSEGIKRSTTAGGDSQQNGVIGLYVIENDVRNAGAGFSETSLAGCTINAFDQPPSGSARNFTMTLVPISITAGANNRTPDSLTVFYGSQAMVNSATTITSNMPVLPGGATAPIRVMNRYGYRVGDLIVLLEPGSGKNCTMLEVTGLPSSPSDQIDHASYGAAYNLSWAPGNPSKQVRANPSTGLAVQYTGANTANATRVFNLGNLYDNAGVYSYNHAAMPVYNTYAVSITTLTVNSAFRTTGAVAVADNIVHLRALYGLDDGGAANGTLTQVGTPAAGDGKIDRWVDATTFAAAGSPWQRIIAVRVVIVARSALPERGSGGPGSACDTTTVEPTWSGSAWSTSPQNYRTSLDLTADADWQCYRYKTFETTIPLRNWIWKSS